MDDFSAPADERRVRLKISGPAAESGHVPLLLLAKKLQALQRSLYNVATSERKRSRRGNWESIVRRNCQLLFVETKVSSLEIVAELPAPDTFPFADLDLGTSSLGKLKNILIAVQQKKADTVEEILPDTGIRARVMKSLIQILPEEEADYEVEIGFGSDGDWSALESSSTEFLNQVALEESQGLDLDSIRTIVGRLYRIEVVPGERQIGLDVDNRLIICQYPDSFLDLIPQLMATSLVEVEGRAILDPAGNIVRISEVYDIREAEVGPLTMRRIMVPGKTFVLRNAIMVNVEYTSGLWTHEYEPFGILAFAATRHESLKAFRDDFAFFWEEIAQERDEALSPAAQQLKQRMRDLIEKEENHP